MTPAESIAEFIAAPVGRVLSRRTFSMFAPTAERMVSCHLASLDATEIPLVPQLVGAPDSPGLAPEYDLFYDCGAVEAMDRATYTLFEGYVRSVIDVLVRRVRKMALVKPPGLPGVMFAGMFHEWLVPRLRVVQAFEARDAALDWFAAPAEERAVIEAQLDAFTRTSPLVRRMRGALARDLREPTLETVAAELGTSSRSLQRHLGEVGTTFRDELARARVRAAQKLLVDTDDKIEAIAADLGFKSVAAFTTMFRGYVGDTPAAYRETRRR